MRFKKILVSDDNQLVLSDYGLNEGDVEIIDLNKSLHDVANDPELREFIMQNIIDNEKIYIVCVKEDFGTNDQLLEDIEDIKTINKTINKSFKKVKNIYFFVYNTFMKSENAINPSLGSNENETNKTEFENTNNNEHNTEENSVEENSNESFDEVSLEENQEQEIKDENFENNEQEEVPYQEESIELKQEQHEENVQEPEQVVEEENNQVYEEEINHETGNEGIVSEIIINNEISQNHDVEAQESDIVQVESHPEMLESENGVGVAVLPENSGTQDLEQLSDEEQLDRIIEEFDSIDTTQDQLIKKDIQATNEIVDLPQTTSDEIFDEKEFGLVQEDNSSTIINLDSVDSVAVENNENNEGVIFENRIDDSVDMPESYFDATNEDQISYDDYNEFVNDYELSAHALKSIYDFIWRLLVLNNQNIKLNDLLYIAVNNLDAFSIGQSDFVRQIANRAESLFDLILQLDVKLEFNNSLFYIYLAQFFSISRNKILVNTKFLDTLSIWVDKAAKKRFVDQVEQFMNYSSIYNKKIIYSYFIELSNFIKGCLPSINPNIALIDIHRILNNPSKRVRQENVFGIMISKINSIFQENGIVIEMHLVETPDNIFDDEQKPKLDANSDSWKTQLTILYKKLVENVLNYILLKGNNETEIFNLYVDIKDLRLYNNIDIDTNILSPETTDAISNRPFQYSYGTIGDTLETSQQIVSSQISNDANLSNEFLSAVEKGINTNFQQTSEMVETSNVQINYPSNIQVNQFSNSTQPSNSFESLKSKYAAKFNMTEFENAMSRRIEEYEKKIKDNIARIEAERKQLRQKMEDLKNI